MKKPILAEDRKHIVAQGLIIGGGTVGMVAALDLAKRGIGVVIVEKGYILTSLPNCPNKQDYLT